jgi:Holliday junction resolvasome RuvABC endonuclease subunit
MDEDNSIETFYLTSEHKDWDIRSRELFTKFHKLLIDLASEKKSPDAIYIEQAVYIQNIKATLAIDSVINAVKFLAFMNGVFYNIVDNKFWKKSVLGNGQSSKEQIMAFANLKWPNKINNNQDIADSACIALCGLNLLKGGQKSG